MRRFAISKVFLHELPDAKELFEVIADERDLLPEIIEKDYWLMHCLWGIQQNQYSFELKGGTSLSKGYGIIERFSEDIDIQIHPNDPNVKIGNNHDKQAHIESRAKFYDDTSKLLNIPGLHFERDKNFDDSSGKMRSGGIKGVYTSFFNGDPSLKPSVILELGFDQTTPNTSCDITSWAFEKAVSLDLPIMDNRAANVSCYCPEYTFVEKLQTISTKYRLQQEQQIMPINFLRHYYDVYMLLGNPRVISFIGTDEYNKHKEKRFRTHDEVTISKNPAFLMETPETKKLYSDEFRKKSAIYFGKQPSFDEIIERIHKNINRL